MDGGGRKLTECQLRRSYLGKSGPDESTLLSSGKISPSKGSSAKLTGKKSKVIGIKRNVK
jgi:hypothetical protein